MDIPGRFIGADIGVGSSSGTYGRAMYQWSKCCLPER
jgi:hypothetical protein